MDCSCYSIGFPKMKAATTMEVAAAAGRLGSDSCNSQVMVKEESVATDLTKNQIDRSE